MTFPCEGGPKSMVAVCLAEFEHQNYFIKIAIFWGLKT
jgi:hypothetical protein